MSVLLRKSRSYAEIYNDMDGEIVNLFRVLRDKSQSRELIHQLNLTPFAHDEFTESYLPSDDPIEQARRTIIRSFMGFGTTMTGKWTTGFRANANRSGTTPAKDWVNYPGNLSAIVTRLQGVVIENKPAIGIIKQHDSPRTLHYIDPPYPYATRGKRWAGNAYRHEMDDDHHRELANVLHDVEGMVVISGYACDLYDTELYPGWHRVTRKAKADGSRDRTEVLWSNSSAVCANSPLFSLKNAP